MLSSWDEGVRTIWIFAQLKTLLLFVQEALHLGAKIAMITLPTYDQIVLLGQSCTCCSEAQLSTFSYGSELKSKHCVYIGAIASQAHGNPSKPFPGWNRIFMSSLTQFLTAKLWPLAQQPYIGPMQSQNCGKHDNFMGRCRTEHVLMLLLLVISKSKHCIKQTYVLGNSRGGAPFRWNTPSTNTPFFPVQFIKNAGLS